MSHGVHQVGADPGFCSLKWLGKVLQLPRCYASLLQGYPQN